MAFFLCTFLFFKGKLGLRKIKGIFVMLGISEKSLIIITDDED